MVSCLHIHPGQRGNTMLVVLVFLALLASLGLTVMEGSTLQERMVFNMRDRSFAFQAAESALLAAQQDIIDQGNNMGFYDNDANGYYSEPEVGIADVDLFDPTEWTDDNSVVAPQVDPNVQRARYFIQYLGTRDVVTPCIVIGSNKCVPTEAAMFRIVARGVGTSNNTVVLLESQFSY